MPCPVSSVTDRDRAYGLGGARCFSQASGPLFQRGCPVRPGGGEDERLLQHGQGDVAAPGAVAADWAVVESGLVLGVGERVLDYRPADSGQLGQGGADRGAAAEIRQRQRALLVCVLRPADKQLLIGGGTDQQRIVQPGALGPVHTRQPPSPVCGHQRRQLAREPSADGGGDQLAARDSNDVADAFLLQPRTQRGVSAVDLVASHPGERSVVLHGEGDHCLRGLRPAREDNVTTARPRSPAPAGTTRDRAAPVTLPGPLIWGTPRPSRFISDAPHACTSGQRWLTFGASSGGWSHPLPGPLSHSPACHTTFRHVTSRHASSSSVKKSSRCTQSPGGASRTNSVGVHPFFPSDFDSRSQEVRPPVHARFRFRGHTGDLREQLVKRLRPHPMLINGQHPRRIHGTQHASNPAQTDQQITQP